MAYDWSYANNLSKRIVDMLNAELDTPEFKQAGPLQMLAGLTTAMLSYMDSATPVANKPAPFLAMRQAMGNCLVSMYAAMETDK